MFRKGKKHHNLKTEAADDIVSDSALRWFWISWSGNVISWGRGNKLGEKELGSYTDEAPCPINFMSVGSYNDITAHWVIPNEYY